MNVRNYAIWLAMAIFSIAGIADIVSVNMPSRIREGDVAYIQRYLAEGGDPNASVLRGDYEFSLLYFAVISGEYEIAKHLLEAGADPNHYVAGSPIIIHLESEIERLREAAAMDYDGSALKTDQYEALKALLKRHGSIYDEDENVVSDMRARLLQHVVTERNDVDDMADHGKRNIIIGAFADHIVLVTDDTEDIVSSLYEEPEAYREVIANLKSEKSDVRVEIVVYPGGARTAETVRGDLHAANIHSVSMSLQPARKSE